MKDKLEEIDDYLAGRLVNEDLDQFELELLTDVDLQREVQAQISFREALADEAANLLSEPAPSLLNRLLDSISKPAWSISATSATAVLGVALFFGGAEKSMTGAAVHIEYVEQTRSAEPATIQLPANQVVVLSLDSLGVAANEVKVDVVDGNRTLVSIPAVQVDQQQLINVMFGPLPSGQFTLQLTTGENDFRQYHLLVE